MPVAGQNEFTGEENPHGRGGAVGKAARDAHDALENAAQAALDGDVQDPTALLDHLDALLHHAPRRSTQREDRKRRKALALKTLQAAAAEPQRFQGEQRVQLSRVVAHLRRYSYTQPYPDAFGRKETT